MFIHCADVAGIIPRVTHQDHRVGILRVAKTSELYFTVFRLPTICRRISQLADDGVVIVVAREL